MYLTNRAENYLDKFTEKNFEKNFYILSHVILSLKITHFVSCYLRLISVSLNI